MADIKYSDDGLDAEPSCFSERNDKSLGFFQKLGCEAGPLGMVMRRPVGAA